MKNIKKLSKKYNLSNKLSHKILINKIKKLQILHKKAKKLNIKITKKNKKKQRIYKTEKQLLKEIKMKKNKMKKNKFGNTKNKFGNKKNVLVLCADSNTIQSNKAIKMLNSFPETRNLNYEFNIIYIGTAWDDKGIHNEKLINEDVTNLSYETRELLNKYKPFDTIIYEYCTYSSVNPNVIDNIFNQYANENTYFISPGKWNWQIFNFEHIKNAHFRNYLIKQGLRYKPYTPRTTRLSKQELRDKSNGELYEPVTLSLYKYKIKNKFGVDNKVTLNDLHKYETISNGVGKNTNSLLNLTAINLIRQGVTTDTLRRAGYPKDFITIFEYNQRELAQREFDYLWAD